MKLTRLLLLVSLLVSLLVVPEAFGARSKRGGLRRTHKRVSISMAKVCEVFLITCDGTSIDDACCGSVRSCSAYCDETCGFDPGTCGPI
ncbi:MAG TPA: hypothetical protein VIA62_29995 [Thermoanaerobaculia bacterium]|jgi:hypothetical protein|nr:hypothetical protein [Thermoanaerobaculia bacterium]